MDVTVPGQCCFQRTLDCIISPKSQLAIHGIDDRKNRGDAASSYSGNVLINYVKLKADYESKVVRKLMNGLASVFQVNRRSPDRMMSIDEVLHYSHSYRAMLEESMSEVKDLINTQEPSDSLDDLMRDLAISNSAWSLIDIMFFQEPMGGELIVQLMKWLNIHHNDCQIMVDKLLQEDMLDEHIDYWPTVYECLLQGRVSDTVTLLHAAASPSQAWTTAIELLKSMPLYQASGMTLMDFKLKWQRWQQQGQQISNDGLLITSRHLLKLVKIIIGDPDAIKESVQELSLPWYSYLLAEVFYTQPFAKLYDIQEQIDNAVDRCGGTAHFEPHDQLVYSILKKSVIETMKVSTDQFTSWWFAAHVADVLYQAGYLREKNSVGTTMWEHIMLDYGGSLMEHSSLWSLGVTYLSACPDHGREHLQEYISRVSLTTTKKAFKVLSVCEKYGFTQQASSICRVLVRRSLNEGRLGMALTWCRESKDSAMATLVAERFFDKYNEQTLADCMDVLDALGSTMLISKNLIFLAKFREFHQLRDSGEERLACELLVNLLSSRTAPKRYWFLLMLELLPLLESPQDLFTPDQVYDLMNCLTELKMSKSGEKVITGAAGDSRLESLQLALTRCLAKVTISDHANALTGISIPR